MNIIKKAALGLAMLAGATAMTTAPADARVTVGFGVGGPGYYGGYYDRVCDPYSRWYDPYRCDRYDGYYGGDYYGPAYIGGVWFGGGYGHGWHGGHGYHGGNHWNGGGGHWGGGHGGGHWGGGGHGGGGHHH